MAGSKTLWCRRHEGLLRRGLLREAEEMRRRSSSWEVFGLEEEVYARAAARMATNGAWAESEELQIVSTVFGVGLHVFDATSGVWVSTPPTVPALSERAVWRRCSQGDLAFALRRQHFSPLLPTREDTFPRTPKPATPPHRRLKRLEIGDGFGGSA